MNLCIRENRFLWENSQAELMAPLPHILLNLTPWKPRPSKLLESPMMKMNLWVYHFTITDRSVVSLCLLPPPFWSCTFCSFYALYSEVSAGFTWSTINLLLVKLPKSKITAHLHSFVPLFPNLQNQLPLSLFQLNARCFGICE